MDNTLQLNRIMRESQDIWSPYKELHRNVSKILADADIHSITALEEILVQHKITFVNLLQNAPKDDKCRNEIRQYVDKNLSFPGLHKSMTISEQVMHEAFIISDLFKLNEYVALDLICTAENQLSKYPGLSRGVVAILLYYDARSAICDTLCLLAQSREGNTWELKAPKEFSKVIAAFMDQLISCNLISTILDLLEKTDPVKDCAKIQKHRGFGNIKYQCRVVDLMYKIRQSLADAVFYLAAQTGLPYDASIKLLKYISAIKPTCDSNGVIDSVVLSLEMAFLYCIDVSILHGKDDREVKLPLLYEEALYRELIQKLANPTVTWAWKELQALTQFSFALTISNLKTVPMTLRPGNFQIDDKDEDLITFALDDKVFQFIHDVILPNKSFATEEFFMKRMHTIFTDFITLMPLKISELRNEAEAIAKTLSNYNAAGLTPPCEFHRTYENFCACLTSLYENDRIGLELNSAYWHNAHTFHNELNLNGKHIQSLLALNRFLRSLTDKLIPELFEPCMNLLAALAKGPTSAKNAFMMLNTSGPVSWDHFFRSLREYTSVFTPEPYYPYAPPEVRPRSARSINPTEVTALQAVLKIIRVVAESDKICRVTFMDQTRWNVVSTLLLLVKCPVPIPLKADLINCVAVITKDNKMAKEMWNILEGIGLLASTTIPQGTMQSKGIENDLEEVESKREEYPLTRAVLNLILTMLENSPCPQLLGVGKRVPGVGPYYNFVIETVFLNIDYRIYRNPAERWQIIELCLKIMNRFLDGYEPTIEYFFAKEVSLNQVTPSKVVVPPPAGHHLMLALTYHSGVLKLLMDIIDESVEKLENERALKKYIENASYEALQLLLNALKRVPALMKLAAAACNPGIDVPEIFSLERLLLQNRNSKCSDNCLNIIKFVSYAELLPSHATAAVQIWQTIVKDSYGRLELFECLKNMPEEDFKIILESFVASLDIDLVAMPGNEEQPKNISILKENILSLLIQCCQFSGASIAHLFLGFNARRSVRDSKLSHAGPFHSKTCLHSIIEILDSGIPEGVLSHYPKDKINAKSLPYSQSPKIMEKCFTVVYYLCQRPLTSVPTLKYLSVCSDFLARHLKHVSVTAAQKTVFFMGISTLILKCVSIDLRNRIHKTYEAESDEYLKSLLIFPNEEKDTEDISDDTPRLLKQNKAPLFLSTHTQIFDEKSEEITKSYILKLFLEMDFIEEYIESPQCSHISYPSLIQLLTDARMPQFGIIDMNELNKKIQILMSSMLSNTTTVSNDQTSLQEELKNIIIYAKKLNENIALSDAKLKYFESWSGILSVLFLEVPCTIIPTLQRYKLLNFLISQICVKILNEECQRNFYKSIAINASTTILLLTKAMRDTNTVIKTSMMIGRKDIAFDSILIDEPTMKTIINDICRWISIPFAKSHNVRANLYGALMTFLYAACVDFSQTENNITFFNDNKPMWQRAEKRTQFAVKELLNGDLLKFLVNDAINGNDLLKLLACNHLSLIIKIDTQQQWLSAIDLKHFVAQLIPCLTKSDSHLIDSLKPYPKSLKPLYLFDSFMNLLSEITTTKYRELGGTKSKFIITLSEMKSLSTHPYPSAEERSEIPSMLERYQQIIYPSLTSVSHLLNSTSVPLEIRDLQLLQFFRAHQESLILILKCANPLNTYSQLKIIHVIVRIINDIAPIAHELWPHEDVSCIMNLSTLLRNIIPKFRITLELYDRIMEHAHPVDDQEGGIPEQNLLLVLEVMNWTLIHLINSTKDRSCDVVNLAQISFKPTCQFDGDMPISVITAANTEHHSFDMGLLIDMLLNAIRVGMKISNTFKFQQNDFNLWNSYDRWKEHSNKCSNLLVLKDNVERQIEIWKRIISNIQNYIESTLFIFWLHLDVFFRRNIMSSLDRNASSSYGYNPAPQELSNLRKFITTKLSPEVELALINLMKGGNRLKFVEMLLRRIKRLIEFVPIP